MNLTEMVGLVRKDLHDEDSNNYRWTDAELARHILRAVGELSESVPLAAKATVATVAGTREIDITALSGRIMVAALEFPVGAVPPEYQQFSIWGETLMITSGEEPDGADCVIFYGTRHTLDDSGSTLPEQYENLVAEGAGGYAAITYAGYAINKVNAGGAGTPAELREWGNQKLDWFRKELKRLGRRNRVRNSAMFNPETA
jgi:hypothetical protein